METKKKKLTCTLAPLSTLSSFYLSLSSNLMARQDLADLGIGPDGAVEGGGGGAAGPPPPSTAPPDTPNAARRAGGFVAGVRPTKKG